MPHPAARTDSSALPDYAAETLLQAWGAHQRREIEDEVGLPGVCPSCSDYEAPDWVSPPAPVVSRSDVERACWVMIVMSGSHRRLHRDARDHWRDGRKLGWQRAREAREVFGRIWVTWDVAMEPANAL